MRTDGFKINIRSQCRRRPGQRHGNVQEEYEITDCLSPEMKIILLKEAHHSSLLNLMMADVSATSVHHIHHSLAPQQRYCTYEHREK